MTILWQVTSSEVVKDFPWQMTLTLPRLFKLCTVNLSVVMEVKEFWQMQICQDIFHNSSQGLPKNLTSYFGSKKLEKNI